MKKIYLPIIILVLIIAAAGIYFSDYYHADGNVYELVPDGVNITNTSNGVMLDGYGNDTALIFYPGAKVEYTSYIPMLGRLADEGVDSYIVEMPLNIAFLNQNAADEIISNHTYSHYFIAGHSLGGVAASSYENETGLCDGVILLASYPTKEISKPVLSIYGSNDSVFNMDSYNKSKNLMENLTEVVLEGANHAQFANYGDQSGDGPSDLTSQAQQSESVNAICDFIDSVI